MDKFKDKYTAVLNNIAGVQGTSESSLYVEHVQKSVNDAIAALQKVYVHRENVSSDYLKGWLSEQWHAETIKTKGVVAGKDDIWARVNGSNEPGKDVVYGDSSVSMNAEIKYYKSGEATAKAISRPDYESSAKIVPSDQKDSVIEAADKLSQKNQLHRPEQAEHYKDTADRADDRLRVGETTSKPFDEKQAKEMAEDFKQKGDIDPDKFDLNTESFVEWTDIARESGEAAMHAAALAAALSAAPHIWKTLNEYFESGEIKIEELLKRGENVLQSAGAAGLRGGVAAALTASCKTGLMGDALVNVSPSAIGMATTMTINAISYSIRLQKGEITKQEFAHRCLRDSFALSGGAYGAAIGQMIIPVPLLGALVGNLVGATIGALAYEGTNKVVLGVCVESGWTFFGLVGQDYTVPEDILRQIGYDLFSTSTFTTESFSTSSFSTQSFNTNSLSFTPVRRGVISLNLVGYQ